MTSHAFAPHRFVESETRCHCGEAKSKCPAAAAARALLADVEAAAADMTAERELHAAISRAADHCANSVVAMLSLLPFVSRDVSGVDFYSDAMDAAAATMRELLAASAAALAIATASEARADQLVERMHSVKVRP